MKLTPLFFLTAALICQISCSSKDSDAPSSPAPKGGAVSPVTSPGDGAAGPYDPYNPGPLWASDVSDEKVQPCPAEQIFANGKCYDEVHFLDASFSLSRPGETLVLFEAGKPLGPFVLQNYKFSEEEGGSFVLINERLAAMGTWATFASRYWFLPAKIRVSKTADKKDLSQATFLGAEFPLSMTYGSTKTGELGLPESWYFKGSIFLCGKILALPVIQGVVETECGKVLGSDAGFSLSNQFGGGYLEVEYLTTTIAARRAHWAHVGNAEGLR